MLEPRQAANPTLARLCQEEEKVEVTRVPERLHKVPVEELFDHIAQHMITWSAAQGWCDMPQGVSRIAS